MLGEIALEGSRWTIGPTSFSAPSRILTAHDPAEVAVCLEAAEQAAREGSWVVGLLSYDAAPGLDPRLRVPGQTTEPLVWFGVYDGPGERETIYRDPTVGGWTPTMSREEHGAAVGKIIELIESGHTYQTNLTFAVEADVTVSAAELFRSMIRAQQKSYGAFIDLGDSQIVSVSPELFLSGRDRRVTTRPMKGTAPRGLWWSEDVERRHALAESEKEQAGNIMVVDLLRNDLGRVCHPGSVEVPELFTPERYPTVWQMTSTVTGLLEEKVGLVDLLKATFPSGSVTGAPKVSTMDAIARLETIPRGVYCGAIGFIAPGGDEYEFSVAIRTGVVRNGTIRYHVGGGITHDSVAGSEYQECLWKALAVTADNTVPALLETMRYEPGVGIELLSGHLRRLSRSCEFWEIPLDLESVGEALSGLGGHSPQKARLIVWPGGQVELEVDDLEEWAEPVELTINSTRIDASERHWYHKTIERSHYPDPAFGEAILVNLDGDVTETNLSSLLVRFGETWFTPPISSGCLPGVARQKLIDSGAIEERVVSLDELATADELAVTNAVRGWRKAVLVD